MENKKLFNRKAPMVDLQSFMKLDTIDEFFIKGLFFKLLKQKRTETISAAIKLDELSLLSYSLKSKLLSICAAIVDSLVDIDEQEKLKIRKNIVIGLDNAKKFFFIAFEFFPFSTKLSIISDPGEDENQTSLHVCGLIRETTNIPYAIEIFNHTALCFAETIHINNDYLYNVIATDFLCKVIANKQLNYKLSIELSNVEKIREQEINFAIEYLGLRTFEQVETTDKNLLLVFDTEKDYENPLVNETVV